MYTLTVKDHIMIAHSLPVPVFGPAQNLHGATYIIEATFIKKSLDKNNLVIDIGIAARILASVIKKLNYKNLDALGFFKNIITTTEYMAGWIHAAMAKQIIRKTNFTGALEIKLQESHIASASYSGKIKRLKN